MIRENLKLKPKKASQLDAEKLRLCWRRYVAPHVKSIEVVMKITGKQAVIYLDSIQDRVDLHRNDNTDKFWSYKLKFGKRTEFAFDPATSTGLFIRVDREPPQIAGLSDVQRISSKDVSTALGRVFSGGLHKANYQVTIENKVALDAFICYYESL